LPGNVNEHKSAFLSKEDNFLVERKIQVVNKLGLHARPAAMLVQTASRFRSEIRLKKDEVEANAKSILSVMMLAAEVGSFVIVKAEGEDEEQAAEALAKLFEDKFGEE
jgi:phosphocarrier protein HPr